ncbi:MAG: M14 family zinc carboxypeptidase [Candidatus Gracilibacteria bacterium]|jgi:predicted deacylase
MIGSIVRAFQGIIENTTNGYLPLPEPDLSIGKSLKGKDIFAYKFGDGSRKILFMGGIHGNEVGTVKLMHKLIDYLNESSKELQSKVYVIPCLNPDGHEIAKKSPDYFGGGRFGRFNANNVDLNRNFEAKSFSSKNNWFFGNSNVSIYCGESPLSEPESRLFAEFVKNNGISIVYSLHNRGKEVMGSKDNLAQKLTRDYAQKTGYKYISEEHWKSMKQTGTLKEWCENNNVSYVEVESGTRYGSDWKNQKNAIIEALNNYHG